MLRVLAHNPATDKYLVDWDHRTGENWDPSWEDAQSIIDAAVQIVEFHRAQRTVATNPSIVAATHQEETLDITIHSDDEAVFIHDATEDKTVFHDPESRERLQSLACFLTSAHCMDASSTKAANAVLCAALFREERRATEERVSPLNMQLLSDLADEGKPISATIISQWAAIANIGSKDVVVADPVVFTRLAQDGFAAGRHWRLELDDEGAPHTLLPPCFHEGATTSDVGHWT